MKKLFLVHFLIIIIGCAPTQKLVFGYQIKKDPERLWERGNPEVEDYVRTSFIGCGLSDSVCLTREIDGLSIEYIGLGRKIFSSRRDYFYINGEKLTLAELGYKLNYDNAIESVGFDKKGRLKFSDRRLNYLTIDSTPIFRGIYVECDNKGHVESIVYDIFDDSNKAIIDTFPQAGYGYWKSYYLFRFPEPKYNINNNPSYISAILKEEGEVKKNMKYGLWKYYDPDGNLMYTKTYEQSDRVPVLFPFSIINKLRE